MDQVSGFRLRRACGGQVRVQDGDTAHALGPTGIRGIKKGIQDREEKTDMYTKLLAALTGLTFLGWITAFAEEGQERGKVGQDLERQEEQHGDQEKREEAEHVMSVEQTAKFMQKHAADALKDIEALKKDKHDEYNERMNRWAETKRRYEEAVQESPQEAAAILKEAQVEHDNDMLAKQIRETRDKAARDKLIAKLRESLSEVFEAQFKDKENQLKELQKEMQEIKETIDKRRANKEKILDRRISDMIEEGGDLNWDW